MKKSYILFCLVLSLTYSITNGQNLTLRETETHLSINLIREGTVAFGIEQITTYQDINGKVVTKNIFNPIGTGICMYVKVKDSIVPCLVTAKHVIYDKAESWSPPRINIRFREADTFSVDSFFGDTISLYINKKPLWFSHPDSSVDLACIPIAPNTRLSINKFPSLPYSLFASEDDYFEGKEIFVLGYPSAIGLDLLNQAFLRKGTIAWVAKNKSFRNDKILIDCNIFPGNSGGPVFSVSHNLGEVKNDTTFQYPRLFGIVSQRRFSGNKIYSINGLLRDYKGAEIYSNESTAVGVIITAKKITELLKFVQDSLSKQKILE